jgi:hypothetical protein
MHAKLAVADRRVLLVTSANLTPSGVGCAPAGQGAPGQGNIEAGLLITGGPAPARVVEPLARLQSRGALTRCRTGQAGARTRQT